MTYTTYRTYKTYLALILMAVLAMSLIEIRAAAQGRARTAAAERRVETLKRQSEQYERENLKGELKRSANSTDRRTLTFQVKQDFEDLQKHYNQIVLTMAAKEFNDKVILDAVDAIRKCSLRLKSNLALPQPKPERTANEEASPQSNLEELLMSLRGHVYSFVTNPLFESPAVLDLQKAEAASRDLDLIIELSAEIQRNSQKSIKP